MSDEGPVWSMRNLKPFEGRSIFYAKILNERVVRAKGGISIDIPFCTDLYISPFSLVIDLKLIRPKHKRQLCVSPTALRRPYCKLPLLSLTREGTSLPTFWSLPTRICQLAVWRPLYETRLELNPGHIGGAIFLLLLHRIWWYMNCKQDNVHHDLLYSPNLSAWQWLNTTRRNYTIT